MSYDSIKLVKLKDICVSKGSYGIAASAVEYDSELPTYLRITDIDDFGNIDFENLRSVDDEKSSDFVLQENDIVFARTGASTGRAYYHEKKHGDFVYAGFLIKFSLDPKKVNPKYMKYFTLSEPYKNWVKAYTGGSTRGNINAKTYGEMDVILPHREQQNYMVSVLSSLDDKIELNNKINKNLEEIAQTLYMRWFVDFEFPNEDGEPYKSSGGKMVESELGFIPRGWVINSIGDICNTVLGGTPSRSNSLYWGNGHQWLKSGELNNLRIITGTESITDLGLRSSATKLMPVGTTLIAITGYVGIISMLEIEACANQSVVGIIPNAKYPRSYVYSMIKEEIETIASKQTGSAQQHINKNDINTHKFICPPISIISKFSSKTEDLHKKIATNLFENHKLMLIRDLLLPKLMSGEIEVPIRE